MKTLFFILFNLYSVIVYSQEYPNYSDGNTRVIFETGIGFASIGGVDFDNELGVNFKKNTIGGHANLATELGSNTSGKNTNDFWIVFGITYGRMKTFSKSYLEFNIGPSYYGYFDRYLTSSQWLETTVKAVGVNRYQGFGGLFKVDYCRDFNQKIGLTYSLFFQLNKDKPLIGLLLKLNLRSVPK